jgi:hypothetical protein
MDYVCIYGAGHDRVDDGEGYLFDHGNPEKDVWWDTDSITEQYRNALKWIHHLAGMHFIGGAFEPSHMRDLANIAADGLSGAKELPHFDKVMQDGREKARQWLDEVDLELDDKDEKDEADE